MLVCSAENGAFLKHPNEQWQSLVLDEDDKWKKDVLATLDFYTERIPGIVATWDPRVSLKPTVYVA